MRRSGAKTEGTSATPAALALEDVQLKRPGGPSFGPLSLTLPAGSCLGLAGLNGAGKTTLLRLMAGLLAPAAGQVRLFGVDPTRPQGRRRLAFLPEGHRPPPAMSGRAWARATLGLHGRRPTGDQLAETVAAFDMDPEQLTRSVGTYSQGTARKLAVAVTVLSGADLLILDEPAAGLDPRARRAFHEQMAALSAEGRTVVMSSHDLSHLGRICHRVAVLHAGRILACAPPADLGGDGAGADLEAAVLALLDQAGAGGAPSGEAAAETMPCA